MKPCPFCGKDVYYAGYVAQATAGDVLHYYECIHCKARGPVISGGGFEGDPQMDAKQAWNLRATLILHTGASDG